jgi:MFS family permease
MGHASTRGDLPTGNRLAVVAALGTTQTLAWASSYYLPAILADPVARDLGIPVNGFFAAFSCALVLSALIGPSMGRMIDRSGGRSVLCASNLVLAAGLALLATVHGVTGFAIAWAVLGIGMGMGLYDAAFATLARAYGAAARTPITGITLIAGFASTLGWPLTAALSAEWGWRSACFTWAAIHLLVCLPLNRFALPSGHAGKHLATSHSNTADTRGTSEWSCGCWPRSLRRPGL